jgi:hypothetical protein
MPTHERKAGLQKKFSAIFDGVWIPEEAHVRRPSITSPTDRQDDIPLKPEALTQQVTRIQNAQADSRDILGATQPPKSRGAAVVGTLKQITRRIFSSKSAPPQT